MTHPTDDLLSAYALEPLLVKERGAIETHLSECTDCQARLDSIRSFDVLLADAESWPESESALKEQLLEQEANRHREDVEADELLRPILTGTSASFVWANLAQKRRYRTGGVVRRLIKEAADECYRYPLHALNLADTAVVIASALSENNYNAVDLASWRGTAWKMRANALRLLGRHPQGLEALVRAEHYYRTLPRPEFDLAAVLFVRATLFYEQQEYGLAGELADTSAQLFSELGQTEMYLSCQLLQGAVAFEMRDLGKAEAIFRRIYAHGHTADAPIWIARGAQALGNCRIENRSLDEAEQYLRTALRWFGDLQIIIEEIRCRWGLARVAQMGGRLEVAIPQLKGVRDEFSRDGITTDAALVTVDLMESYLALHRWRDVRVAAGDVVALFQTAGMITGALTAANWLRHAARMKRVTPSALDEIRRYFKRLSFQPDLAFVPPPGL